MADYIQAYAKVINHEGGYVNDPDDQGGETYMGISRKTHPNWEGWDSIDQIKSLQGTDRSKIDDEAIGDDYLQDLVLKFYLDNYWNKASLDKFPQQISNEIFDTGVNQGLGTAIKYLQSALNLLNNNGRDYRDIAVDGNIGLQTVNAFHEYMETVTKPGRNIERNIKTLLKVMNGLQFEKYHRIVEKMPNQEMYFYGWLNRV